MAAYLVFGRTEYARPLALLTTVEADAQPRTADLGVGADWLELVLVPSDEVIWILRDGALVAGGEGSPS
jgi:hypothetical protein